MNKCFILIAIWYNNVESPSSVVRAFSSRNAACEYGCEWWKNYGSKYYHHWKVEEVDYD